MPEACEREVKAKEVRPGESSSFVIKHRVNKQHIACKQSAENNKEIFTPAKRFDIAFLCFIIFLVSLSFQLDYKQANNIKTPRGVGNGRRRKNR